MHRLTSRELQRPPDGFVSGGDLEGLGGASDIVVAVLSGFFGLVWTGSSVGNMDVSPAADTSATVRLRTSGSGGALEDKYRIN